jgi:hypothetical protein
VGLFAVRVDMEAPEPTDSQIDVLMDVTRDYSGAWGSCRDLLSVQLSVHAETLRQACDLAFLIVADVTGQAEIAPCSVVAVEAMTDAEFEERQAHPVLPELLSTEQAAALLGVSRQAVVKRAADLGGVQVGERRWVFPASKFEVMR